MAVKESSEFIGLWFSDGQKFKRLSTSIYFACLAVCLSDLFESNKRQNGWTDRAQILCGTSHDPREGLWMLRITKTCIQTLLIFVKFKTARKNIWNIRELSFVIVLYCTTIRCSHKEPQLKVKIENGRDAPSKPS